MIVFKFPNEDKFYTLNPEFNDYPVAFHDFFGKECLKFKGKIVEISKTEVLDLRFELPTAKSQQTEEESKTEYIQKIKNAIACVQKNHLPKLVIARKKTHTFSHLDVNATFLNLCEKYPTSFVYVFAEQGVSWIGAFAEVLGIYNKKTLEFSTMSLAGTLPIEESWSEKELEEQKPVTDYINSILAKYGEKLFQSERYDHPSGNIKHLRTDLRYGIAPQDLEAVLHELHPTPAVCGIPKDFCKTKIADLENFNRELYAGYSKIQIGEKIACYITLRCGKLFNDRVELFAGGGITAASNSEKEWQETELKMSAVEKSLIF